MAAQTESLVVSISEKGALVVKRNIEGIGKGAQTAEGSVKLLRTALGSLIGVAGVAGAVMVFRNAIGTMANFSQQMSTVGAISRATQTQMEDLRDTAKDLGIRTRFSASQAAEGMVFLARAGFNTNEVLASIGPTLQLAQAGALGLGEAADIASNVLTGFNIAATESARVIDVLALAANSSNTNVQQLGEAMSYVAPISASLGVSLEQTAAAVEVLSNAGIQASRAGTNLTMVMRLLQSPTKKQQSVLEQLKLTSDDVSVAQHGLTTVLKRLNDAGITTTQVFEFFGRSAASASVLLRGAEGDIQGFTKANEEAKGTAENVAKVMDDNLNGALIAVKSAWEGLILAFGDLGAESELTKFFRDLAAVLRWTANNLDLVINLTKSLGIAFAALKWSQFLASLAAGNLGVLKLAEGMAKLKAVMTGFALNPLTIGLLAVAAAAAAVTLAFDQLRKKQMELEAADEKAYKTRLAVLQAQVKEIQDRKAAEASLTSYIDELKLENLQLQHLTDAQEDAVDLTRAMTLAKRPLTEEEVKLITKLQEEKAAIQEVNKQRDDENALLAELRKPMEDYNKNVGLLNSLLSKGKITQAEFNAELARMQDELGMNKKQDTGYADYLKNLERETQLLAMSNKEREIARALDQAKAALPEGQSLTQDQTAEITQMVQAQQAQRALNDETERKQQLLQSILGPEQMYKQSLADLNELLVTGQINQQQYNTALQDLQSTLPQVVSETQQLTDGALSSLWSNATSALDNFVDTGVFKFKDFARSVISDITKIAAKMLLLQAFRSMGIPIPGFATGGSFMVGGQSGTDQNLVAFKASRGERVDVLTPAQQSAQTQGQSASMSASVGVTIINVVDPSEIPAIMASEAGQQATLNTISLNGNTVRQAIS